MKTIQISTRVFAKIWSHRIEGEEDENAILERLLGVSSNPPKAENRAEGSEQAEKDLVKVRWRDDVLAALVALGGEASLSELYGEVRDIRRKAGRSLPKNVEAIVRRELEYNSSDSHVFTGRFDWFRSVSGLGSGVWAARQVEGTYGRKA